MDNFRVARILLDTVLLGCYLAVDEANILERASQVQLLASASGQSFSWTSDEDIAGKREKIFGEGMVRNVWNYYCRRIGPL